MDSISYVTGTQDLLDEIQPLWEQLRQIHVQDSIYFKERFKLAAFEVRKQELLHQAEKGKLSIVLAKDQGQQTVGYCVSSFVDGIGEIESICVDRCCRRQGIGRDMMEQSLAWIRARNPKKIILTVAVGHEEVYPFYNKFGFYPRIAELELIQ